MYEFFTETTVHGLNHIQKESPRILKIFWMLMFLLGLSFTSVVLYNQIMAYKDRAMSTEYNIITTESLKLPTLSICSPYALNGSVMNQNNVSRELKTALNDFMRMVPLDAKTLEIARPEYDNLAAKMNTTDFRNILEKLTISCVSVIHSCTAGNMYIPGKQCCKSMVVHQTYTNAKCFNFLLPEQVVSSPGFKIYLRGLTPDEMDTYTFPLETEGYFGVFIDVPGSIFKFPFGKFTNLVVKKTKISSVNNPPKYVCNSDMKYSFYGCYIPCMNKDDKCECEQLDSHLFKTPDRPVCSPWEAHKCREQSEKNLSLSRAAECEKKCPQPCTTEKFESKIVQASIDPKMLGVFLRNQQFADIGDAKEYVNSFAMVRVSYEQLEYTEIRQKFAMSITDLMSNFGGLFGLFLGGSVLSVVHALVFVVRHVTNRSSTAPKRQNSGTV